ncbi:PAS domain-containing protein [Actinoplanes regularis]|uniref:PAS domain-containing protein n=1 Tax=Actinoplanes regularis TaxID=52697 RepID=UPI0024A1969D|nr:sensor histidine kinase [Actinoplanes regularis]GLW32565.1 hypothetical protein Areg01_55030 [Actinoplanes regularis]
MERERLAAPHEYRLGDTPPESELSAVLRIAATIAGVTSASLNLIDERRQYRLIRLGEAPVDCSRPDSMCAIQFKSDAFVHVRDARVDPIYQNSPWVTGVLGRLRFYASAPLVTPEGHALGTLCVFGEEPRELTAAQRARLTDLAGIIIGLFDRRRAARLTSELAVETQRKQQWTDMLLETIDAAVIACDENYQITFWNRAARDWHGRTGEDPYRVDVGRRFGLFEPDGVTPIPDADLPLRVVLRDNVVVTGRTMVIRRPTGEPRYLRANARPLHGSDGAVIGAVLAKVDVTTEVTRRHLIEQARMRLTRANAELERSNADLTNFAAAVSHDLVAPLAAVGGFLELLAGEGYPEAAAASAQVMRMREVIDGLLADALAARSRTGSGRDGTRR